ncbi:MAG: hypothetical protein D6785_00265 [Planctomycetota bacterium]|nr:MAG: hypothetical protein D6785_00265 [Planctomycetota bacterium]
MYFRILFFLFCLLWYPVTSKASEKERLDFWICSGKGCRFCSNSEASEKSLPKRSTRSSFSIGGGTLCKKKALYFKRSRALKKLCARLQLKLGIAAFLLDMVANFLPITNT